MASKSAMEMYIRKLEAQNKALASQVLSLGRVPVPCAPDNQGKSFITMPVPAESGDSIVKVVSFKVIGYRVSIEVRRG